MEVHQKPMSSVFPQSTYIIIIIAQKSHLVLAKQFKIREKRGMFGIPEYCTEKKFWTETEKYRVFSAFYGPTERVVFSLGADKTNESFKYFFIGF